MTNFLTSPDTSLHLIKLNHISSKLMIPLITGSFITDNTTLHSINTINIGFHSYFSMSCVITDYIKNKYLSTLCRVGNLHFHVLAAGSMVYYLNKKDVLKI